MMLGAVYQHLLHCFFFFQAEDGIRDVAVTGVQTCALPISFANPQVAIPYRTKLAVGVPASSTIATWEVALIARRSPLASWQRPRGWRVEGAKIGRASCRGRV